MAPSWHGDRSRAGVGHPPLVVRLIAQELDDLIGDGPITIPTTVVLSTINPECQKADRAAGRAGAVRADGRIVQILPTWGPPVGSPPTKIEEI